ncbi:ankyrin repeat domain-containing protein [Capnocytophaga periodontitidis]|uniref:ankyrin repeat domain-containing protein n=1 Tax=Capnocytophaga periodontitidis TaxID=2795027 RepID=UPI0018E1651D|nr:ankyrin repeat domain-containing protein [Capnocytophaga periodontitidis]MBI1669632.1 ankyrin repeat domain-containing protein [Capnocytophaga periodontitidis]
MAKKKKTLPVNFYELLEAKDLDALKAVFNECELNAYDRRSFNKPALSFYEIPLELMDWLITQGADINARDEYERTPLHYHAQVNNVEKVALLLEKGADIEAQDKYKNTPLHFAEYNAEAAQLLIEKGADIKAKDNMGHNVMERMLARLSNGYLVKAAKAAEVYLKAGLKPNKFAKEQVTRVGEDFEFHRNNFNPEYLEETDAALQELYKLFDVPPVPRRIQHDGKSPIVLIGNTWQERYEQAWTLLVPGSGSATTVQGEVVRIAGRVNDELLRNAMGNWDKEYRKMLTAISGYLQQGNPLSESELAEVADIQKHILDDDGSGTQRLCELATAWVVQNPQPIALGKVNYKC